MLKDRVTVLRKTEVVGDFGAASAGYSTETLGEIWASVSWTKGARAMHEGMMDAYDKVMVRCYCHDFLTRDCLLRFGGKTYVIDSFHEDKHEFTVQMTATEIIDNLT